MSSSLRKVEDWLHHSAVHDDASTASLPLPRAHGARDAPPLPAAAGSRAAQGASGRRASVSRFAGAHAPQQGMRGRRHSLATVLVDRRTPDVDRAHTEKVLPRVYSGRRAGSSAASSESSEAIGEDPENMLVRPARPATPYAPHEDAAAGEDAAGEERRPRQGGKARESPVRALSTDSQPRAESPARRSLSPTTEARLAALYNNYKSRYAENEEKRRSIAKRAEDSMRGRDAIQGRQESSSEYWPGWADDPLSPFEDCYCVYCKCDRRDLCFKHKQRRSLVGGGLLNADYYLAKFASPDGLGFSLGDDADKVAPYHPSVHRRDEPRAGRARIDRDLWRLMEEDELPAVGSRRALSDPDEDEWIRSADTALPRPILRRKSAPVRPMAKWQLHARRRRDRRASLSGAQRRIDHRLSLPAKSPIPWGLDDDQDIPVTIQVQQQMVRHHLGQQHAGLASPAASPALSAQSPRMPAAAVDASPHSMRSFHSPASAPMPAAMHIPTAIDSAQVHATLASPRVPAYQQSPTHKVFSPSYVPHSPHQFQRSSLQTFQLPPAQVQVQSPSARYAQSGQVYSSPRSVQQSFQETSQWSQSPAVVSEFEWGMGYDEVE